jgi:hypothetical protein
LSSPRFGRLAVLVLAAALSACASWHKHGVAVGQKSKVRLGLLPVALKVKVSEPERVRGDVAVALTDSLDYSEEFELMGTSLDASTRPWTADRVKAVAKQFNAQVLLQVSVVGYGKLRTKTLLKHIGTSAVKGTVEGAIVAGPAGPVAGALALTYSLLEGTFLWTTGTFIFNKVYTPVVLEVRLYSGADGGKIWSTDTMSIINKAALKQLPPALRENKDARLTLAAEKAVDRVVFELAREAKRNAKAQAKKHGAA